MQGALVAFLLLGAAAAESSRADGKNETSDKAVPSQKHSARLPFESIWHQYLPEGDTEDVAGDSFPGQSGQWFPHVENKSDPKSWRDAFMKVYAKSYLHFAHAEDDLPAGPEKARDAGNMTDLKKWKARQDAAIKGFVPKEFQDLAKKDTEKRFEQRAAEIRAEENATSDSPAAAPQQSDSPAAAPDSPAAAPAALLLAAAGGRPMKAEVDDGTEHYVAQSLPHVASPASPTAWKQAFLGQYASSYMQLLDDEDRVAKENAHAPAHAKDCKTVSELRAWRDAQEARVKAFVPKEYRSLAEGDVKDKFERREAAIKEEAAEQKQQQEDSQAAAEKQGHEDEKPGSSAAGGKQEASEAGDKHEQDAADAATKPQANATLLAADSTLVAALQARHTPLLALAFLLASFVTGALVARHRSQRTLDVGSSYLLVTEA